MTELVSVLQTVGGWGVAAVALVAVAYLHRQLSAVQEARVQAERDGKAFALGIVERQATLLATVQAAVQEATREVRHAHESRD